MFGATPAAFSFSTPVGFGSTSQPASAPSLFGAASASGFGSFGQPAQQPGAIPQFGATNTQLTLSTGVPAGLPPPPPPPPHNILYHLTQYGRAHDCQAKGRRFKSCLRQLFSLHAVYLQLWALWVPGEESWGWSKNGEESQEGQMRANPSLNMSVQSAKSGCYTDGKESFVLFTKGKPSDVQLASSPPSLAHTHRYPDS